MDLCWITLNVRNFEESLKFYTEVLGLKVASKFSPTEGMNIAMVGDTDKPKIELIYNENNKNVVESKGLSIGFEVDSLEKTMEDIKNRNISIKRGPISPTPKVSFFYIEDPNGVEVQLVESK